MEALTPPPVSDESALGEIQRHAELLLPRMTDGEAKDALIRLSLYWRIAVKKAKRRKDYGLSLGTPLEKIDGHYHILDEDGKALCLDEDVTREAGVLCEFCDACMGVARELSAWKL